MRRRSRAPAPPGAPRSRPRLRALPTAIAPARYPRSVPPRTAHLGSGTGPPPRRASRAPTIALARAIVLAAALVVVTLLPAGHARAYARETVDGDPSTPLAWPRRELHLRIAYDTSADLSPSDVRDAIGRSLSTWSRAGGCTDVVLFDDGDTTGLRTNLMGGTHDGENRVVFREDAWPPELGPETLAITTLVYRRSTGEILDGDVDLNALDHAWGVDDVPLADRTDLENTATHELGHFLGFAHVLDPEATMYGQSDPGDVVKRDLAPDDVDAVCEVYPAGRRTPGGGGGERPPIQTSCAIASAPGATRAVRAPFSLLALSVALSARARRRRAARRSTPADRAGGTAS